MPKITITEALAEIKTIGSRVQKKREAIMRYFSRDSRLRDPLEKEGGSVAFVSQERQAINDLNSRLVAIRSAIQRVNLETKLRIGDLTLSVAEWLNWRREVADGQQKFLGQMASQITAVRSQAARSGVGVSENPDTAQPGEMVVAVNERGLSQEIETMATILGSLDGQLSLINATVMVEV